MGEYKTGRRHSPAEKGENNLAHTILTSDLFYIVQIKLLTFLHFFHYDTNSIRNWTQTEFLARYKQDQPIVTVHESGC